MPRTNWPGRDEAPDHNAAHWLAIKWCELLARPKYHIGRHKLLHPGWYVVRTCPCHWGERVVTRPYRTREGAEGARQLILSIGDRHADA